MILGYETFPNPSDALLNHTHKYVLCDSFSLFLTAMGNGNKSSFQSWWTLSILKSPGTSSPHSFYWRINNAEGQNLTPTGKTEGRCQCKLSCSLQPLKKLTQIWSLPASNGFAIKRKIIFKTAMSCRIWQKVMGQLKSYTSQIRQCELT